MSLQSFGYFLFLPLTAALFLRLPQRWQNPFLLAASAFFYLLALPQSGTALFRFLPIALLLGEWAFCWRMGLLLGRTENEAENADAARRKKHLLTVSILVILAVLALFKYYNLSPLPTLFAGSALAKLPFPLGISFFSFAAIGYLVDVARGDIPAEKSGVNMAVFLFFFGTITSGPICRGGALLPQLQTLHRPDASRTAAALRLFGWGLFKKVAVADVLMLAANEVFADYHAYGGPMLLLALVFYTFQLYFDFSGYSDMARASGLLLGLSLPENFKTPFFATNFSGFWSRWHISLSSWLQDYIFTPLVWADTSRILGRRHEHLPALFCVFTVFFVSGFWHGNTLPFVVWGLLQAAYRVGEELLHQHFGRPKKKAPASQQWAKRFGVFCLWCVSMVFFRIGSGGEGLGVLDGFSYLFGIFRAWNPARFVSELFAAVSTGFYADPRMVAGYFVFLACTLFLAIRLDFVRGFAFKNKPTEDVLAAQKHRILLYEAVTVFILLGLIFQNGGFGGGASFSYANF